MNKLRTLFFLELRSLYGINRFLYTKDPKEKKRSWLLAGVMALLLIMVFFYVGGLVWGLCALGLEGIVPAYLTVIASALIVAFGIFTAGNRIFGQQGEDILASLPVKPDTVVLSRFLCLYVEDLVLTLVIALPGFGMYALCCRPEWSFYGMAAVSTLLIPAVPLVLAVLFGTVTLAISSRMKHKSLVQSALAVAFVVGLLVLSFGTGQTVETITPEAIAALASTVGEAVGKVYPPAMWLNRALLEGDWAAMGAVALISLGLPASALWVVSCFFDGIRRRLRSVRAKHDYRLGALQSRGLLKALCIREARRYFSSSIYVTNTIVGPILGTVMSVALCVAGPEALQQALELPLDISGLLPFVVASVFCLMTTSCTSISMEGRQFWVIQSLPIPAKTLLDSKLLLNLGLMLPFFLISVAALAIGTKPDVLQLLWLILIPACIMVFSVVFGITVNLKFHSFDWEREETVVKQSLSSALGGFGGFLLAVLLGFGAFAVPPQYGDAARGLMCLAVLGITAWLYKKNNRTVLSEL